MTKNLSFRIKMLALFLLLFSSGLNAQLENILNSISSDSLMTMMKELTGAAPVQINGKTDTIKTRAHLTTYNRRAQKYIQEKLLGYGLQTETRNYYSYSPPGYYESYTDVKFYGNSWWLCTDWGEIFQSSSFPVIESKNISGIPYKHRLDWMNFFGNDTITAMGKTGYFLISPDGGQTWRKDSTGLKPLTDFIKADNVLIAAGYNGKIWRSTNKGNSWTPVQIDNLFKINDCTVLDNYRIIAAGRDSISNTGKIYTSSDKGLSWTNITGTFPEPFISCASVNLKSWLLTDKGKVFYSVSSENWSQLYTPDSTISAKKISFSDSLHGWILSNYNMIYRSSDKGYNWSYAASIDNTPVIENFLFTDSLNGIVTGKQHYGIITTDGGESWEDKTIPLPFVVVGLIPGTIEPEKAVILAAHTDCIINLKPSYEISGFEISHGADDDGSGTVALLELARVFKKYPAKYTLAFTFIPTEELGHGGCGPARDIVFENVDSVVFGLDLDMIGYDSLNSNLLMIGYNNNPVSARVYSNLNTFFSAAGIPISTMPYAGTTTINICLPNNYPTFFIIEYPINGIYVQSNYHDITDTWNSLNYNFYTSVTKAVALTAYHISTGELLSADNNESNIPDYYLSDAYPNPFNPVTIINFSLPVKEFVKLKVYDILGNEIGVLVNKEMPPGEHNVSFDASRYSSGIYFYRLESGNFIMTKKMAYIR